MRSPKLIFVVLFLLTAVHSLRAQGSQGIDPSAPPPPPPAETPAPPVDRSAQPIDPSTPPPPPSAPTETAAASSEPIFDPYHAQRSLDVGTFYMKQGKYDAAIDRFEEAAHYQPSLAMPWRLMGEAYEKKHDYPKAIESYKKYLELFPRAEDSAKLTKQISVLGEKIAKESLTKSR